MSLFFSVFVVYFMTLTVSQTSKVNEIFTSCLPPNKNKAFFKKVKFSFYKKRPESKK
jgi:hypothetical protein